MSIERSSEFKMKLLPIVAFEAFRRDFPDLNYWESLYYVREQEAMKFVFGIKATIKFIKNDSRD